MSLDPAGLQILISRLGGIAEEMGAVLRRAAFSPNIKERADCSAALFTPAGEMLVQAEHIPVHLGSMPASVQAAIDAFGDRLGPGDQVVVNDPFAGGTHLNDITLVMPCFVDGLLVGWAANRAHHADVGGAAPGSIPADATEIHQEGLRIPPTLLDDGLRGLLLANSRTPDERIGDLAAQEGANVVGVERLAALAGAPFAEVHRHLVDAGLSPGRAFTTTMRALRAGGLTKDAIYLRGLLGLLDHLRRGGTLDLLWSGKLPLEDLPLVGELGDRGLLAPPKVLPRYLADPATDARLARAAKITDPAELIGTNT
ncbi:MAG: DUF1704 domain-containing protein [Acidimicrobiales bacterium]|nr:DUF1704 domain-containing protein [Acidimicrobiales bacterium]